MIIEPHMKDRYKNVTFMSDIDVYKIAHAINCVWKQ